MELDKSRIFLRCHKFHILALAVPRQRHILESAGTTGCFVNLDKPQDKGTILNETEKKKKKEKGFKVEYGDHGGSLHFF